MFAYIVRRLLYAPLILIGAGLSICYRSNNWNIGAEGQFIMGAIAGAIVPVVFHEWHSPLVLPLMLVFGMIGGALYAAIPAFLKASRTKISVSRPPVPLPMAIRRQSLRCTIPASSLPAASALAPPVCG